jgi:hypothetical protein
MSDASRNNRRSVAAGERYADLVCDQAVYGYGAREQEELGQVAQAAATRERESLERAAAALHLALMGTPYEPMPSGLKSKLMRSAESFRAGQREAVEASPAVIGSIGTGSSGDRSSNTTGRRGLGTSVPWLVAAASIAALAVVSIRGVDGGGRAAGRGVDLVSAYRELQALPTAVACSWGDWDKPEISGVTGEVVWCDRLQKGYMRLKGLPANDPNRQQYQLWIIDTRGLADATGQSARISGGVFDVNESGEVIVPISPALFVQGAKAFAITIERPGGTWVSSMERRVAIASLKS